MTEILPFFQGFVFLMFSRIAVIIWGVTAATGLAFIQPALTFGGTSLLPGRSVVLLPECQFGEMKIEGYVSNDKSLTSLLHI